MAVEHCGQSFVGDSKLMHRYWGVFSAELPDFFNALENMKGRPNRRITRLGWQHRKWIEVTQSSRITVVKIVGRRKTTLDAASLTPEEALRRADVLQAEADRLNPFPRPRGFVFKARTREEYDRWRANHPNPRLR